MILVVAVHHPLILQQRAGHLGRQRRANARAAATRQQIAAGRQHRVANRFTFEPRGAGGAKKLVLWINGAGRACQMAAAASVCSAFHSRSNGLLAAR